MSAKPRKWLILLPVLIGLAVLIWLVKNRAEPEQAALTETARSVRVIEVPQVTLIPRALGYGNVAPGAVWEAVAEVNGKIVSSHPALKSGELISGGSELLRIDPSDYELTLAQAETDIQGIEAQLAELGVKQSNTLASLEIERQALTLAETELERKRKLVSQGTVTKSAFDQEQRTVLTQKQGVRHLQNTLNLIPTEGKLLQAQLGRNQTLLSSAKLNLERTVITMPFAGRLAEVNVERTQFVRQGEVLVRADSIDVAEITAQLPMSTLRRLIKPNALPVGDVTTTDVRSTLGLEATVRFRSQDFVVEWPAQVVRASDAIDTRTRTVGIVVAVDQPYQQAQPGIRPPLIKGLFVEVELRGQPRPQSIVIPRSALRDGEVYLVDHQNRLQRRPVKVAFVQTDFVVISEGLSVAERLVISDVMPASEGMLLAPVADEETLAQLLAAASGRTP